MPSGITSDIYEGKKVTVEQYLERVARSMTDFIHMRDVSHEKKLTKRGIAKEYAVYLEEKKRALEDFLALSGAELSDLYEQQCAEMEVARNAAIEKNTQMAKRYRYYQDAVKAIDFPEEIAYAKGYALKYLAESVEFDVLENPGAYLRVPDNYFAWYHEKMSHLTQQVEYYTKEYHAHLVRDAEFNAKIDAWSKVVGYDIV